MSALSALVAKVNALVAWIKANLAEHDGTPSNTRLLASLLVMAAIVFAFVYPDRVETLIALLAAGTGNVALRTRTPPPPTQGGST